MGKPRLDSRELDPKSIDPSKADRMPPSPERTEAVKATQDRNAADVYGYLFSSELKPPV